MYAAITRQNFFERKLLFFLLAILFNSAIFSLRLNAETHLVGPNQRFATLSDAIAAAQGGDSVRVFAGTYKEPTIIINKAISIQGIGNPVFDGDSLRQIFTVTADSVRIRGLTLTRCGTSFIDDRAAIKIESVNYCVIENCRFINNFFAIYLAKSQGSRIIGNKIIANTVRQSASANGIHLWYCKDVVVSNNEVIGHRDGIYFEFVKNGFVKNNTCTGNLRYGLHFMFSDHCRYIANTFRRNGAGVAVMYTKNVEMDSNRFEHNWGSASYGLLLKDISDSRIRANHFTGNSIGMYLENSNRTEVVRNTFQSNGWAVKIMANCTQNQVSENNFIANAFDVATNSRNNFSRFEGNYWSAYNGYDLDKDGTGDVPFRPVRLFALIVEKHPPSLILLRSIFVDLLDVAERVFPVLTPETLVDTRPAMKRFKR
ncbi:MAG: nitrous oxide reductase family maturation protein NosD [Calditrichia bacterium]